MTQGHAMTRSSSTSHLLTPLLGGLALSCLTLTATAQEVSTKKAVAIQLPEAVVIGQLDTPDVKVLDQLDMRRGLRNDLAEALTMVPSVRVADTASSSLQQGDLKPAEFSIRGAAAYQNKIMLDGASIDNMLDPANKESQSNYTSVAGHSQSVFIDPRFVKELQVIDVNASATEGNFTGGIVKAETQSYSGRNTFEISQRRTQDSWTKFHVDKKQEAEFGDGAAQLPTGLPGEFQPNFKKSETALSGSTRFGDLGVFAGYSEKRASIKQKQVVSLNLSGVGPVFKPGDNKSIDRHSRYAVMRADLLDREYDLNASLAYSDYSEDSFIINYLDSDFAGKHNGLNLSVNFGQKLGQTKMDLNVNTGLSADERNFKKNILNKYEYKSIFDYNSFNGGYGELANQQQSIGSTLGFTTPINDQVNVKYGGEFKWAAYKQDRANNFIFNTYQLASGTEYLKEETIYGKGEINFTNLNLASYAELEGDHDRFFWRSGLRLERDGWLKNTNWAPRFLAGVYLDDNKTYQIRVGANRYYGKSFLAYRLREKERRYVTKRTRKNPSADWITGDADQWQFRDLDTPYDDEYSIGLFGPALSGQAGLQVVQRRGRKQIRTKLDKTTKISSFENSGASDTYQVDLFWRSQTLAFAGVDWTFNSALALMDKKTDSRITDTNNGYTSNEDPQKQVIYKGKVIDLYDLPAGDFATPITANFDLITQAFNDRLFVRNSLSLTNGYRYIKPLGKKTVAGSKERLDSYDIERQGSTARWDMSVEYQLLAGPGSPYIRTDLINVLDSKNVISAESNTQLFGVGRQYWLELGYRF
ncbi:MAG: TonB-dependent receptor plug domain-containing protein [Gammaproteobacteria bacterium]|nr:TonB-dependent receptor plug domain-containing protein [Gammaproteobacteria bacterium]